MSVEDMKDFIESFSAIPDDPKTPFIVAHELAQNEDGTYHLSVIISSHALIDLILKDPSDKLIQVDFTHNLSVVDFLWGKHQIGNQLAANEPSRRLSENDLRKVNKFAANTKLVARFINLTAKSIELEAK